MVASQITIEVLLFIILSLICQKYEFEMAELG